MMLLIQVSYSELILSREDGAQEMQNMGIGNPCALNGELYPREWAFFFSKRIWCSVYTNVLLEFINIKLRLSFNNLFSWAACSFLFSAKFSSLKGTVLVCEYCSFWKIFFFYYYFNIKVLLNKNLPLGLERRWDSNVLVYILMLQLLLQLVFFMIKEDLSACYIGPEMNMGYCS